MIRRIRLLRNIGHFDSVDTGEKIALKRLVLIYAENGRGKTTLAAVLRSLATGDPLPIIERRRLAAQGKPHIVIDCDNGPSAAIFENGTWNRTLSQMAIFDDVFVDENVHSGLEIDARHRRNLHVFIVGAQGVTLSQQLQKLVSMNEQHSRTLREKSAAIPESVLHGLSVDEFCALAELQGVDAEIRATELALAAAHNHDAIGKTPLFQPFVLPAFDIEPIREILARELPDLDAAAEAMVRTHVEALGHGGEQWVSDGMQRMSASVYKGSCPFCTLDVSGSALLAHYRTYFSQGYSDLKRAVAELLIAVRRTHAGDVPSAFERAVRVIGEKRHFWARFCEIPDVSIDTAAIMRDWNAAREGVLAELVLKQAAPLERRLLTKEVQNAIAVYEAHRQNIAELSNALMASNEAIRVVQEQATGANPNTIDADLSRLRATKKRHLPETAGLCNEYLAEKEVKARTEEERMAARAALDEYRTNVFPASETAINGYLRGFNAGFRLSRVTSTMTRGGVACTYSVLINGSSVAVARSATTPGDPSFGNTLSSGDRSTLALAFFFASLDQDPDLGQKVVVFDDPISSLDDHRSWATVQEIRNLTAQAGQVFVLSHDKRFLGRIWTKANSRTRAALQIVRDNAGSTLSTWRVEEDSFSDYDLRHSRMRGYADEGFGDPREVARCIRPHLEGFLRVARPEEFPPGMLLGSFLNRCGQAGQPEEILDQEARKELAELVEYANMFHHETNPAWETAVINDAELQGFVERTLAFVRP